MPEGTVDFEKRTRETEFS